MATLWVSRERKLLSVVIMMDVASSAYHELSHPRVFVPITVEQVRWQMGFSYCFDLV